MIADGESAAVVVFLAEMDGYFVENGGGYFIQGSIIFATRNAE